MVTSVVTSVVPVLPVVVVVPPVLVTESCAPRGAVVTSLPVYS